LKDFSGVIHSFHYVPQAVIICRSGAQQGSYFIKMPVCYFKYSSY
jgi:hypothetical protein